MPLNWTIEPDLRLVTARAEGALSTKDIKTYLESVAAEGRHALCQPVRHLRGRCRPDDGRPPGARSIRQYAIDGYGPLAIVVGQGQAHFQAAFFADASPTNRPLRIFRDARQAREWLLGLRRS